MKYYSLAFALAVAMALALLVPATAAAQLVNPRLDGYKNAVYANVGVNQAVVLPTLGYVRAVGLPGGHRSLLLSAELSVPPTDYGLRNGRLRLGAQTTLLEAGRFFLPLRVESSASAGYNQAYRATAYSSTFTLQPSVALGRWTAGAALAYTHGWATHLRHRPAYRDMYPAARDGWYGNPAGTLRAGLSLGYGFGRHEASLQAGYQQNGRYDTFLPPAYGLIGFATRFGK